MSASMPSPLSAKIELPAAFHEVIAEYKKAIASVKRELKEVEAEAKEVLKTRGVVDSSLSRRAEALKDIQAGLQLKCDAQTKQRQDELAEEQRETQVGLATHLIHKSGLRSDKIEGFTTLISSPLEYATTAGKALKAVGATAAGSAVESAAGGAMKVISSTLANPYIAVALAAVGAAAKLSDMQNESSKAQAMASIASASDFTRLSGSASSNVMDAGSAGKAIRIRNDQVNAQHRGIEDAPRGVGELIANAMGFNTAAQVQSGEQRRQFEAQKEEARQKFGLKDGTIRLNKIDEQMIQRKVDQLERDPAYIAQRAAYLLAAMSPGARLLGLKGEAEVERMERDAREKATQEVMGGKLKALEARRNKEEVYWNLGVQGALNRVMENEKRRWLRAVEQDRSARFNSWSLT
jgi:hypothetical protein